MKHRLKRFLLHIASKSPARIRIPIYKHYGICTYHTIGENIFIDKPDQLKVGQRVFINHDVQFTFGYSKDTIIAQVDTFGGLRASLNDRFVNIDVEVRSDRKTIIDYNILDSISVIQVQKQHSILFGLFKWKSVEETRVVSHNPKTRIVGLETINIVR